MLKQTIIPFIIVYLLIYTYAQESSYGQDNTQLTATVTGEIYMGMGITSQDFIWRQANYDLNEKTWRLLSDDFLNNKENTYDPVIYDQLQVAIDLK
ncbi:MAG: hypothetical protein DRP78_03650 [Candidatus Omnitrophota bacterium]|nr:MAG: hypothetical protein DRP78_03650 [Candidatus Omnitrophota bacterium]